MLPGEGAKYLAKNDEITCGSCTRGRNFITPNRKEKYIHSQLYNSKYKLFRTPTVYKATTSTSISYEKYDSPNKNNYKHEKLIS